MDNILKYVIKENKVSQFLSYMMEKDFLIAWGSKSYRPN